MMSMRLKPLRTRLSNILTNLRASANRYAQIGQYYSDVASMSVEKNRRKCNDITDIASNPNYCIADFIEASKKHEVANDEYSNLRKELDNVIETMLKHSLANLHDRK